MDLSVVESDIILNKTTTEPMYSLISVHSPLTNILCSRRDLLLGTFIKGGFVNELPSRFKEFLRGDDENTMAAEEELTLPPSEVARDWSTPFITETSDPASLIDITPQDSVNDESTVDERPAEDEDMSNLRDEESSPVALL